MPERRNFGSADFQFITVGQSEAATCGQDPTRNICLKGRTLPVLSRLSGGSCRVLLSAGRRFALTYGYEN
jgi:hypothetical protein